MKAGDCGQIRMVIFITVKYHSSVNLYIEAVDRYEE